jgi:hypothetical protein
MFARAEGQLNFYVSSLREASFLAFVPRSLTSKKLTCLTFIIFPQRANLLTHCGLQNEQGQLGSLTFDWSEVTQRVEGLLPLFDQVVDRDARGNFKRKTQTLITSSFATCIYRTREYSAFRRS